MKSYKPLITALATVGVLFSAAFADEPAPSAAKDEGPVPSDTRAALEKWVELRRLISEEENNWRADKQSLESSIELIQKEMTRLDSEIKNADESMTAADKERLRLVDDNEAQKQAATAVTSVLPELEKEVLDIAAFFPPKLRETTSPLLQRIPRPGASNVRSSSGERLQNIVGILSEVEKFGRTITLASELQKLPNGDNAQVDTVYMGLAVAFFVDGNSTYAGILTPAKDGWTVTEHSDLAPEIRRLVEVYKGDVLAEFVPLPVEIK